MKLYDERTAKKKISLWEEAASRKTRVVHKKCIRVKEITIGGVIRKYS